ncbi:hypothetical protein [Niabella ginsengisoli]|uniref:Uncharacterized protein n=1 Tax=Niabella ginsengisoli TaxID=522298 RepID=A0ABS9SNC6_9BACT|nr:hypothetical protein [Niabella ginsengisoli]MCH5599845.1 hypothetical protein [Niabella ginsengisoli]
MGKRLEADFNADVFYIKYSDPASKGGIVAKSIEQGKYDDVIIGLHDIAIRKGSRNYGISQSAVQTWYGLNKANAITLVFGNPLTASNFCQAKSLAVCYEDDAIFQNAAADWLRGIFQQRVLYL